jgi:type I restriction-modification system DNA methylase subunit
MKKINRSTDRIKQTGEVFTPLPLVDEILSKLPDDVWEPSHTFCDPACGDGNFLVRVIAWKINKGSTIQQALETTYGVDLMPDNTSHARARVLTNAYAAHLWNKHNTTLMSGLEHEDEMKLGMDPGHDKIVMKYNYIVVKNIVCANSLDYDFIFSENDNKEESNQPTTITLLGKYSSQEECIEDLLGEL